MERLTVCVPFDCTFFEPSQNKWAPLGQAEPLRESAAIRSADQTPIDSQGFKRISVQGMISIVLEHDSKTPVVLNCISATSVLATELDEVCVGILKKITNE